MTEELASVPVQEVERVRSRLPNDMPKSDALPHAIVADMCDVLWRADINPSVRSLSKLFKRGPLVITPGLLAWRKSKGMKRRANASSKARPTNKEELAPLIAPDVAVAPLTCFDPSNDGRWRVPPRTILSYLGGIENSSVRNVMTLFALLNTGLNPHSLYSTIANLTSMLRAVMIEQNISDVTTIDPDDLLFRVFRGEVGRNLTTPQRSHLFTHWINVRNCLENYAEQLSPEQRVTMSVFFIKPVTDRRSISKHRPRKTNDIRRQEEAKRKTDAVHPHFYRIRFIAKMRLNQARRLYEACKGAIKHVIDNKLPLPHVFSYEETTVDDQGRSVRQRVHLALWDNAALLDLVVANGFRLSRRSVIARRKEVGPFAHTNPSYTVELRRVEPLGDGAASLWFSEFYTHHVFSSSSLPHIVRARTEFKQRWEYEDIGAWRVNSATLKFGPGDIYERWFLREEVRLQIIPVEGIFAACLFAH